MLKGADPVLVHELGAMLAPERVLSRAIDRLARASDASIYRMVPEVVVRPRGEDEIVKLLRHVAARGRHLTFRAAGTSLSGQSVTDGVLVELGPHWQRFEILDGGRRLRAEPGVVGGLLNRVLAPARRRLGPDPASIDAAMIGGILANNSSGMCCGTAENAYQTLDAVRVVLADGTALDTAAPEADAALRAARPDVHEGLRELRARLRADAAQSARLRKKFALKNTTGYQLQALLDHERPSEILARLMVGSQGTLGFVAEATLRTVPEPVHRATALLFFDDLAAAGAAVPALAALGAAAVEILDAASLRSQAADRAYPFELTPRCAALLVEFRADEETALARAVEAARAALATARLLAPVDFTRDPALREGHWKLRKGLFPAVGALRPRGTSVVIEDVAVPVPRLAAAILDLQALFARHGFPDTIVFGHAKDGNLHFVLAEDFGDPRAVARYDRFMRELVELVVGRYDGSLKAEHGAGRNMAPFVRREFGDDGYALLREIKALLDPAGILSPGVVLSDDAEAHLRHLKALPTIAASADRCIECGFCEPRCPSRELSLTPRQRLVVAREIERAHDAPALRDELRADYAWDAVATCAGDAMCQAACPVKIDTGVLMKELRAASHGATARALARATAARVGAVHALARLGLRLARVARAVPGGAAVLEAVSAVGHAAAPELIPRLQRELPLPAAAPPLPSLTSGAADVVYFPSCLTRLLAAEDGASSADAVVESLQLAGFTPRVLSASVCCGMPWQSKGYPDAAQQAAVATAEALWTASDGGRLCVLTDASPCAGTLHELALGHLRKTGRALRVFDFPAFWAREALPRLAAPPPRVGVAVLHPTCTLQKQGGLGDLLAVARAHAERVEVPATAECCGFAGDRGFLVPELTASATRAEGREARGLLAAGATGYSTCRTCELGMTRATGAAYHALPELVLRSLKAKAPDA
ncbi:MAG: FAD-binding oxidoreductase [Vicinamibacteria bacterium]|nr:FAD-binding oxidoreductase [Vicinamibacteria bacterium]